MTPAQRWLLRCALCALALLGAAPLAHAHDVDSASLTLTEVARGRFHTSFHTGSTALQRQLGAPARFPPPCQLAGEELDCGPTGLSGAIELPWLEGTLTRVLVEIEWRDGRRLLRIATPSSPRVAVYDVPRSAGLFSAAPIARDYVALGVEHISTGFDHLLFVIALTLLVRRRLALLSTITAFTLAHSITLAATVLGVVHVARAPLEACIALSIVLVCVECLRPSASLTARAPWLIAFAFGLLHGLGFASALLEVGLPEAHVSTALLSFNVGIELGQLATIAVVLVVRELAGWLRFRRIWLSRSVIYAMGSAAGYFCVARIAAVFQL